MNALRVSVGLLLLTAACGSTFRAGETGDGGASSLPGAGTTAAGDSGVAATGNAGGDLGNAGGSGSTVGGSGSESGGGASGGAATGGMSTGGSVAVAGTTGSSGNGSSGNGSSGANAGGASGGSNTGGSIGSSGGMNVGGTSSGGANGGGATSGGTGGSGTPDCPTLQNTYLNDLTKAQVCDPAAIKVECSTDSTLPNACNCPVLVAAGTAATMKARADFKTFSDAGCKLPACAIACVQYSSAACLASSGGGYTCTGGLSATP